MGIWNRLGNVVKSYLNSGNNSFHGRGPGGGSARNGDPDLDAAYEELEDFLKEGKPSGSRPGEGGKPGGQSREKQVPAEIRADFAALGLTPEATAEECKAAYKKLLKIHHPDRHTANPRDLKKATEKTAAVNAAYTRLEKWFRL